MFAGRLPEWSARQPAPIAYALAHAVRTARGELIEPHHLLVALGLAWAPLRQHLAGSWCDLVATVDATPPGRSAPDPPAATERAPVHAAAALREAFLYAAPDSAPPCGGSEGRYHGDVRRAVRAAWCASAAAGVRRASAAHLVRAVLGAPPDPVVRLLSRAGTTPARVLRETPVEAACRIEAYPVDWAATFLDRRGRIHPQWHRRRSLLWTRLSDLGPDLRGGRWPGASDVPRALAAGGLFQSRRLGHDWMGCAHTVVAMLALDEHLAATGRRLRASAGSDANDGAAVLAAHGVTYTRAFERAAQLDIDRREHPLAARQLAGTAILAEAADAADLARRRRPRAAGTTALLLASLRVPGSTAYTLLTAMDVDAEAVLADATRRLQTLTRD